MKRILMYSHDSYGLGHFRRNLSIAEHILAQDSEVEVLAVTGSPRSHLFQLPENFDYVKLPAASKDAQGNYCCRDLSVDYSYLVRWRSRLLLESAEAFRPDIVLVDHTPCGLGGELLPLLDAWKDRAHLVLGLRDIIDSPARVRESWRALGVTEIIRRYYKQVLYYGDRRIFDPVEAYELPEDLASRLHEVGYVTRATAGGGNGSAPARQSSQRPFVLVTVGGGGDGNCTLNTYMRGLLALGPDAGFDSLLITGPLMSAGKRAKIDALAAGRRDVEIREFAPDMGALYDRADLAVTMGGYNTVSEILAARVPALLIPRTEPREEQLVRARCLTRLGLLDHLHPDDIGGGRLMTRVRALLDAGPTDRPSISPHMDGARGAWRVLRGLGRIAAAELSRCVAQTATSLDDWKMAAGG